MKEIIRVSQLTKRYNSLTAVDAVDFSVHEGSLFAFLGPNGAGKTTTIHILCTLLEKTAGEVTVAGYRVGQDDEAIRKTIGVVFQDNVLDDLLTVRENLLSRGGLYGLPGSRLHDRLTEVADILGVGDLLGRRYGKLSGGQRRRVEIGRALMGDPRILFLDEPTTGLDPQTRISVWQTIRRLQSAYGMTVFLTTHYMEEAENADWVTVIDAGRIAAEGPPHQLKEKYSTDMLRLVPVAGSRPALEVRLEQEGFSCGTVADRLHIPIRNSLEGYRLLRDLEGMYSAFEVVNGSMDDVFVNITGHTIREDK